MTLCPVCKLRKARHHPTYGVLPCNRCSMRQENHTLPVLPVEMVGESIKTQRRDYAKSALQPRRGGVLSKEYLDIYGTKGIKATESEIKKAKYVWTGDVVSPNMDLKKTK